MNSHPSPRRVSYVPPDSSHSPAPSELRGDGGAASSSRSTVRRPSAHDSRAMLRVRVRVFSPGLPGSPGYRAASWRSTQRPRPHLHRNVSRTRQTPRVVTFATASRRPASELPQPLHSSVGRGPSHGSAEVRPSQGVSWRSIVGTDLSSFWRRAPTRRRSFTGRWLLTRRRSRQGVRSNLRANRCPAQGATGGHRGPRLP
jgi:hypothetical protein